MEEMKEIQDDDLQKIQQTPEEIESMCPLRIWKAFKDEFEKNLKGYVSRQDFRGVSKAIFIKKKENTGKIHSGNEVKWDNLVKKVFIQATL